MKEDKLLNDLFESARTEEPKRSYEEVAGSFIKTVPPTGIAASVRELLFSNIGLNSFLVAITGGAVLAAFLMFSSPSEAVNNDDIFSQAIPTTKNKTVKTKKIVSPKEPTPTENNTITKKETTKNTSSFSPAKEISQKEKVEKPVVAEGIIEDMTPTTSNVNIENISPEPKKAPIEKVTVTKPNNTTTKNSSQRKTQISSTPSLVNKPSSNNINTTNNYNEPFTGYGTSLRRLKRSLLPKLIKDGFIDSKSDEVVINIEEKQVIINGIKLKPYLYTKYTSIAQDFEIVPEENRQIRISDKFILVGDFTTDGFKGKAEGHGDQLYLSDFQKEIQLSGIPIDINPTIVPKKKAKISLDEITMQQVLDIEPLSVIFRKNNQGQFLPLTILTNNHFSSNLSLAHQEQPVKLIHGEASLSANTGLPIIYIEKYKLGKKKGTIKFLYDGYEITVQLKRLNDEWQKNRLQVKGKKENKIDMKF